MSQQGERPTGHEDDWWGQLYDDSTGDTGPTPVADSLDDRFASAAGTVGSGSAPRAAPDEREIPPGPDGPPAVPEQRGGGLSGHRPGATPRGDALGRRLARWDQPDRMPPADPPDRTPPATPSDRFLDPTWTGEDLDPSGRGEDSGPSPADAEPGPWWSDKPPGLSPSGETAGPARSDEAARSSWSEADPGSAWSDTEPDSARSDAAEGPSRGDAGVGFARGGEGPGSAPGSWERGKGPGRSPDALGGGFGRQPAPWDPPPAEPSAPASFPPGPTPPGFHAESLRGRTPKESPDAAVPTTMSADVPPRPSVAPRPTAPPDPAPPGAAAPVDAVSDRPAAPPPEPVLTVPHEPPPVDYVGSGPPTYDAEPTALPPADPDDLDGLVADTVLDGARYGTSTLRAASVRGDSARFRGEPRRDSLLTARFGAGEHALVLVAMATGARATPGAHRAAAEACHWIGRAVGRSHVRLAEDIRAARRGDLKSGLHRLTDRSLGKLRASAAEQGIEPEEYTAGLRCLLLTADPECRTRVFFGVGAGGLFRLRDGEWQDIEPRVAETTGEAVVGFGSLPHETPEGDRLTMDLGITTPPSPYEPAPEPPREPFRFRASVARPGDTLLLCTGGLAEPLRGEPQFCEHLTERWSAGEPPGLAAFLADTQVRVKGYADDRTVAAVWEA
ncbi:protein phosphatase 2C domain-containing protein [Streptomyces sp. NBC_01483]|uniref:protein phosphatase 2C domain-containing protein n=1 Tax=Streptomyces sp. NBC_01483 TaxID=2903883 RepID=UPI002E30B09B|nr:protein phosphatase 2C domain-containing protein [Streptomyces sp. NBC_01483]